MFPVVTHRVSEGSIDCRRFGAGIQGFEIPGLRPACSRTSKVTALSPSLIIIIIIIITIFIILMFIISIIIIIIVNVPYNCSRDLAGAGSTRHEIAR